MKFIFGLLLFISIEGIFGRINRRSNTYYQEISIQCMKELEISENVFQNHIYCDYTLDEESVEIRKWTKCSMRKLKLLGKDHSLNVNKFKQYIRNVVNQVPTFAEVVKREDIINEAFEYCRIVQGFVNERIFISYYNCIVKYYNRVLTEYY